MKPNAPRFHRAPTGPASDLKLLVALLLVIVVSLLGELAAVVW